MLFFYFISQVLFCTFFGSFLQAEDCQTFSTYFSYSKSDLESLKKNDSNFRFSKSELEKWDEIISEKFKEEPASLKALRIYTYLYVAQMEAAKLSYNEKCRLEGSLDPVSYSVISLFLPDLQKPNEYHEDAYSLLLAKIVSEKLQDRMQKEDESTNQFKLPKALKETYIFGLNIARWIPWYAIPPTAYWPPPPPSKDDPIWEEQIKQIRQQQIPMTSEKKRAISIWAGVIDPEKGEWRDIANNYLFTHNVPLFKMLEVRSVLMMGIYDGFIVSFSAKYHYLLMRPSAYDPTLKPEIPVPKHPSYPSNHSLVSSLAATILSYFFPAESAHWHEIENEAGLSRIWAGIHYPLDDKVGREAGKEIADNLLEQVFTSK